MPCLALFGSVSVLHILSSQALPILKEGMDGIWFQHMKIKNITEGHAGLCGDHMKQ